MLFLILWIIKLVRYFFGNNHTSHSYGNGRWGNNFNNYNNYDDETDKSSGDHYDDYDYYMNKEKDTYSSSGYSNYPTFEDLEVSIVITRFYDLDYNDFVSVYEPDGFSILHKRIVGMPGDEIKIENGKLYINGNPDTLFPDVDYTGQDMSVVVPEDSYFLMGDNRMESLDSRYYGCFNKDSIVSKTLFGIY